MIVGPEGCGKASAARLAAFTAGFELKNNSTCPKNYTNFKMNFIMAFFLSVFNTRNAITLNALPLS